MRYALALLLALSLAACQGEPLEKGLAAKVNGRPIPLRTLEFAQGVIISAPTMDPAEPLAKLRTRYGETLAGLIVEELVAQELQKRGLEVTEAELKNAETAVRSGYPGRTFEDTLSEEGVDLDVWRERLRSRVALDKFSSMVLRPRIAIAPWEVRQYYKSHAQEFVQPARVKFMKVESRTADALRKALDAASQARDPADLLSVFDDVSIETQALPEDALPAKAREILKGLQPGQAGPVSQGGAGYWAFILQERSEAKVEGLVQVYPVVEKRLSEAKMAQEMSAWLLQALNSSVIEISPGLVVEKGKS